jgi:tRNA G37 N-methylase Trm5/tRNA(Phe) wybutosine-synthesizing methylase Tyw3
LSFCRKDNDDPSVAVVNVTIISVIKMPKIASPFALFQKSKEECLSKRDKSSAGRIDVHAVDICAVLNAHDRYYTTSSCAGRCFLYRGPGIKATDRFQRWRVSHDCIQDATRYFDLSTLDTDPSGGGDPIPTIHQYADHEKRVQNTANVSTPYEDAENNENKTSSTDAASPLQTQSCNESKEQLQNDNDNNGNITAHSDRSIWLRFEPFLLHVMCVSLDSAATLMTAARPAFKNVGLTTWSAHPSPKYIVAIWGDEGLDLPLCTAQGESLFHTSTYPWLAQLVNERHERNWSKIRRFVEAVRNMPVRHDNPLNDNDGIDVDQYYNVPDNFHSIQEPAAPKSFDVIGDIALLHSIATDDPDERRHIGERIMKKNNRIKVVCVRQSNLEGTERAPGDAGIHQLAGIERNPLLTTHSEYGIKCVVDLRHTFFSPRMGPERLRICRSVARGERILVLFAGVGMEALQLASRTEATEVVAIERNTIAVECARRGHRLLSRNKAVKTVGAADRLTIIEGDVLDVIPTLEPGSYDRILAPRPKEGNLDGDLGTGDGGLVFLDALLNVLKPDKGECHWYDFVADHEYPECSRTRQLLERICNQKQLKCEVIHVAKVGSVAMRQLRVCIDFRVSPLESKV